MNALTVSCLSRAGRLGRAPAVYCYAALLESLTTRYLSLFNQKHWTGSINVRSALAENKSWLGYTSDCLHGSSATTHLSSIAFFEDLSDMFKLKKPQNYFLPSQIRRIHSYLFSGNDFAADISLCEK